MNYTIRVSIRPINPDMPDAKYKTNLWNGHFISKGKKCSEEKIKEQVEKYLLKHLLKAAPEFNYVIKFLSIKRHDSKFTVVEDKLEENE